MPALRDADSDEVAIAKARAMKQPVQWHAGIPAHWER